uniref:Uncharacterized protein n=1 Tax=Loa loa TaxID=7209 RepID=A0A1I7VWX1_LOALO
MLQGWKRTVRGGGVFGHHQKGEIVDKCEKEGEQRTNALSTAVPTRPPPTTTQSTRGSTTCNFTTH